MRPPILLFALTTLCGMGLAVQPAQAQNARQLRLAVSQHDILHMAPDDRESGVDIEVEALSRPIVGLPGRPRAYVAGSLNSDGETSYASIGLSWTRTFSPRWSGELQFGYAVHDGAVDDGDPTRLQLGSRDLFRTAVGVDYRLNSDWALGLQWAHLSHGRILAGSDRPNQGLDALGLRLTRTFW